MKYDHAYTPTASDIAALDQLMLRVDEIFGDAISDIAFAELLDPFVRGLAVAGAR